MTAAWVEEAAAEYEGHLARIGGQLLTGTDEFGVEWFDLNLDGWYGSSGTSRQSTQKSRGFGSWRGATPQQAEKHIALSGRFQAPDEASAIAAVDRLNAAVALVGSRLEIKAGGLLRYQLVDQADEPLPKYETDTLVNWSIGVVATDPRKLADDLSDTTALPTDGQGIAPPLTPPISVPAGGDNGQVRLTNPGNETGAVVVRFVGPCVNPRVLHVQSGLTVALNLTLLAGQWVDVDMEAQTVRANGGVSRNRQLRARGWSGFLPGDNAWAFSADDQSPDGAMTVTATPSWK